MSKNENIPRFITSKPVWADPQDDSGDYLAHQRKGDKPLESGEAQAGEGIEDDDKAKELNYDGRKDRWFGYDIEQYKEKMRSFSRHEEAQAQEMDPDVEVELKELGIYNEFMSRQGTSRLSYGKKQKVEGEKTVRLLEDKAVYLANVRNGDVKYDPKTRLVRDEGVGYVNDKNLFVRHSTGEAKEYSNRMKLAWDEDRRGIIDDNYIANPTLSGLKMKNQDAKSSKLKSELTRQYNTHSAVFGSYYKDGQWGYKCCKKTGFGSVCS